MDALARLETAFLPHTEATENSRTVKICTTSVKLVMFFLTLVFIFFFTALKEIIMNENLIDFVKETFEKMANGTVNSHTRILVK